MSLSSRATQVSHVSWVVTTLEMGWENPDEVFGRVDVGVPLPCLHQGFRLHDRLGRHQASTSFGDRLADGIVHCDAAGLQNAIQLAQ